MLSKSLVVALLTLLPQTAGTAAKPLPDEKSEVRNQVDAWWSAWQDGDATAIAAHYAEDADKINDRGTVLRGKQAIEKYYRDSFAASDRSMRLQMDFNVVSIRLITKDVAIVDALFSNRSAGLSSPKGLSTTVLVKKAGVWLRASQRSILPGSSAPPDLSAQGLDSLAGN